MLINIPINNKMTTWTGYVETWSTTYVEYQWASSTWLHGLVIYARVYHYRTIGASMQPEFHVFRKNSLHKTTKGNYLPSDTTVRVKKSSDVRFSDIFHKRLRIFQFLLHTYYTFLSTVDYKFLFSYLQLWRCYAILSAKCSPSAEKPKRTRADVFESRW